MSSWAKRKRSRSFSFEIPNSLLLVWFSLCSNFDFAQDDMDEKARSNATQGSCMKSCYFVLKLLFLEKTTVILYRSRCFASPCGFDCENITPWCFLRSGWHFGLMRNAELWLIFAEQNFLFGRIISSPTKMCVFYCRGRYYLPVCIKFNKTTVERTILNHKLYLQESFLPTFFSKKRHKKSQHKLTPKSVFCQNRKNKVTIFQKNPKKFRFWKNILQNLLTR